MNQFRGAAVVMGVAGCGKTTVGKRLAHELGVSFVEGDLLHPPGNVAKMTAGIPLEDSDRWPWLDAIREQLAGSSGNGLVVSCSALKRRYRQHLILSGQHVHFVFLDGSRDVLEARLRSRTGHFMPASLLESQLATLEPPGPEELAIRIDINLPMADIVQRAAAYLLSNKS